MNPALAERVLAYIEKTDQAMRLAHRLLDKHAKQAPTIANAARAISQRLVDLKLIQAHEKQAAAEQLSDHPGTLSILHNLLTQTEKFREKAAAASHLEPGRAVAGRRVETRSRLEPVERRSTSRADDLWVERLNSYS